MPKASRNERKKRQVKRTNSLLKRQLRALSIEAQKSYVYLMSVLAQKGGEITLTKGTIQEALRNLATLGYQIGEGANDQEVIIRLVVVDGAVGQSDAVEPTTVEEVAENDNEDSIEKELDYYVPNDVDGNVAEVAVDATSIDPSVLDAV